MERKVAIIGVGIEKAGESQVPSWELFASAAIEALKDADLHRNRVEALHVGNVYSAFTEMQTNIAPLMLTSIGIESNVAAVRYETACASSSIAFHQAYLGIASGMYDVVLVGGAERLRSISGTAVQEAMASSMDGSERSAGLTFAAYWSYVARAYARKHRIGDAQLESLLAEISVKNHYHGSFNDYAHFQKEVNVEAVLGSPQVAPPIKVMDCCPFSDGAAAFVLAAEDVAKNAKAPIWVAGTAQASGSYSASDRDDLSVNPAISVAARKAFAQARIGPKDIGVAEVHDCVNIHEVVCLESAGLFDEGRGIYAAAERETYFDGSCPVNLSGGLKSRGHPVGATGAYQICEIAQQLRGDFNGKRPEKANTGMTVNVGGTGTAVTVNIFRREE
ncbi:MAG: hypothetical protein K9K88_07735 [Desulfobacterales bacterium]|nr:hypothetical protein [Desulfobacterales bacterium]